MSHFSPQHLSQQHLSQQHLSEDQFSECLAGETAPLVARHLKDCAACRAELASFEAALVEFRGAVRSWSEDRAGALLSNARVVESRWTARRQFAWASALAAICVIAS